jgi:hypothetical protein
MYWSSKNNNKSGNTKGGSITVPLTSCLTGLDKSVLQIKTKIVSSHTADSKPVKQEVTGAVMLPPLVFPEQMFDCSSLLSLPIIQNNKLNCEKQCQT